MSKMTTRKKRQKKERRRKEIKKFNNMNLRNQNKMIYYYYLMDILEKIGNKLWKFKDEELIDCNKEYFDEKVIDNEGNEKIRHDGELMHLWGLKNDSCVTTQLRRIKNIDGIDNTEDCKSKIEKILDILSLPKIDKNDQTLTEDEIDNLIKIKSLIKQNKNNPNNGLRMDRDLHNLIDEGTTGFEQNDLLLDKLRDKNYKNNVVMFQLVYNSEKKMKKYADHNYCISIHKKNLDYFNFLYYYFYMNNIDNYIYSKNIVTNKCTIYTPLCKIINDKFILNTTNHPLMHILRSCKNYILDCPLLKRLEDKRTFSELCKDFILKIEETMFISYKNEKGMFIENKKIFKSTYYYIKNKKFNNSKDDKKSWHNNYWLINFGKSESKLEYNWINLEFNPIILNKTKIKSEYIKVCKNEDIICPFDLKNKNEFNNITIII